MILHRFVVFLLSLPLIVEGIDFTFHADSDGWTGGFADYPVYQEEFYNLDWGWDILPTPICTAEATPLENGVYLMGNNHSDDLFMYIKRKIGGLRPSTPYSLKYTLIIETNVSEKEIGIGGSPGESVYFKAGASTIEPDKVARGGFYYLNVDKGNQGKGGKNALVIGHLANAEVIPDHPEYLPKTLTMNTPLKMESDEKGEMWLFLGTDSGFEGVTKFYIAKITLNIEPDVGHE